MDDYDPRNHHVDRAAIVTAWLTVVIVALTMAVMFSSPASAPSQDQLAAIPTAR